LSLESRSKEAEAGLKKVVSVLKAKWYRLALKLRRQISSMTTAVRMSQSMSHLRQRRNHVVTSILHCQADVLAPPEIMPLPGHGVVISAFRSRFKPELVADAARSLLAAVKAARVERLVIMSTAYRAISESFVKRAASGDNSENNYGKIVQDFGQVLGSASVVRPRIHLV
jgi:putative NADH-flavin reductase